MNQLLNPHHYLLTGLYSKVISPLSQRLRESRKYANRTSNREIKLVPLPHPSADPQNYDSSYSLLNNPVSILTIPSNPSSDFWRPPPKGRKRRRSTHTPTEVTYRCPRSNPVE